MKTLVLSDIHYPKGSMRQIRRIINAEKPDYVVLLGDIVEGKDILALHKRFVKGFKRIFPLSRTVYLLGDNDHEAEQDISDFVHTLKVMNKSLFSFQIGNMKFMHGNIGYNHFIEHLGLRVGLAL
ncbi:MAG: metallophosphoesterase, partial [Candidatus Micrarchaeaceae archaeon]